ncbi:type IV secretory system conjugative DNA transfer family protein [Paenibacillus aestuarii]|uniref:Type IV secretory system conjugative DNA transfer family protein n=1 Tax=Paenibacillus aestuarii TaxID=516965 RepID=A0ABW0K729_9BACL
MSDSAKNIIKAPPVASAFRKWQVDTRERLSEWYRAYFHTVLVTIMIVVNSLFGYSAFIIYLSRWKHAQGSAEVVLTFIFDRPPHSFTKLMNFFFIPFDTWHWAWMIFVFNLPLINWFYSTVTQPIKNGYKTIISWTSERGRIWACILSAIPFVMIYCALIAWYVDVYMFDFFASISSDKPSLVVKSMASFGYLLMALPVFLSVIGSYLVLKQFYVFEDLQKQFFTWEFPLLARQSFSLKNDRCDVIVGWEKKSKKPIVLNENSRFLHELICGATGTGKTSTTILMRITQDLIRIARGQKVSIVALEPKGDMVRDVLKIAKELGIPDEKIKVVDPTDIAKSIKFNPFVGPMEAAAESFRGTLNSLTGDQDEFFKGQQEETATLYTLLGKLRYGNLFNIHHMQRMYSDPRYLANIVEEVRIQIEKGSNKPSLSDEERVAYERYERIVSYFEDEVLEYKTWKNKENQTLPVTFPDNHRYAGQQVVESKKDKYVAGAKKYLNDLSMNQMLSELMVAKDGDNMLDLDAFLEDGGILLVNTALGELEELSILLGQFFIRQFQGSVFRRPPAGEAKLNPDGSIKVDSDENPILHERIPTFFTIDEFPLYINESFERMLTLGRSYKVGTLIAIQSLGQLQKVIPGYDRVILGNARNKTVFGGGEFTDNEAFSNQFGEEYQIEESLNESTTPVSMPNQSWGYRYNTQRTLTARFSPTDILELKFKHFICQFVSEEGSIQPPIEGIGKFVNETKFLKKFLDIGRIVLETKDYKALNLGAHLRFYNTLIRQSFSKGTQEVAATSEESNQTNNQDNSSTSIDQEIEQETKFQEKLIMIDLNNGASTTEILKDSEAGKIETANQSDSHQYSGASEYTEEVVCDYESQGDLQQDQSHQINGYEEDRHENHLEDASSSSTVWTDLSGVPPELASLAAVDEDDEEMTVSFQPKTAAIQEEPSRPVSVTGDNTTPLQVLTLDPGMEEQVEALLQKVQEGFTLEKSVQSGLQNSQYHHEQVQENSSSQVVNKAEAKDEWTINDIPDLIEETGKNQTTTQTQRAHAQKKVKPIMEEEEDDL